MKKIITSFIKKHNSISIFIFVSVIYMLITMIIPVFTSSLINALTGEIHQKDAYKFIILIFILSVFTQIFYYIKHYNKMILTYGLQETMEQSILVSLYKTNYLNFANQDKVYLSQRIHTETSIVSSFVFEHMAGIITNLLMFIFAELILFLINPFYAVISLLSVPVYLILLFRMKDKVYNAQMLGKEADAKLKSTFYEQVQMIPMVKLNVKQKESASIYHGVFQTFLKTSKRIFNYMYLFYSIDGYLTAIVQILFFLYGVKLIAEGSMNIGEFTIVLSYYSLIMGTVRYFLDFSREYISFKGSVDFLNDVQKYKNEEEGTLCIREIQDVSIEKSTFQYDDAEKLQYPQRNIQNTGIVLVKGKNGSGKSTLMNIISTLYQIHPSMIKINGIMLSDIRLESLRNEFISYVPQEPCLWSLTLRENVQLQLQDIHDFSEFEQCINEKKLQPFYKSAKHFEEADWDKNISVFSTGQMKKLSILLELLKQKHIILFDEPTASLDAESCKEFISYLKLYKQNHLIFVVSHDHYFNDLYDAVIEL